MRRIAQRDRQAIGDFAAEGDMALVGVERVARCSGARFGRRWAAGSGRPYTANVFSVYLRAGHELRLDPEAPAQDLSQVGNDRAVVVRCRVEQRESLRQRRGDHDPSDRRMLY